MFVPKKMYSILNFFIKYILEYIYWLNTNKFIKITLIKKKNV